MQSSSAQTAHFILFHVASHLCYKSAVERVLPVRQYVVSHGHHWKLDKTFPSHYQGASLPCPPIKNLFLWNRNLRLNRCFHQSYQKAVVSAEMTGQRLEPSIRRQ